MRNRHAVSRDRRLSLVALVNLCSQKLWISAQMIIAKGGASIAPYCTRQNNGHRRPTSPTELPRSRRRTAQHTTYALKMVLTNRTVCRPQRLASESAARSRAPASSISALIESIQNNSRFNNRWWSPKRGRTPQLRSDLCNCGCPPGLIIVVVLLRI